MVGTSGKSGQRLSLQIARPLIVPDLMKGSAGAIVPDDSCTVPLSSACSASPPPPNTIDAILVRPSRILSTSASSCGVVPTGGTDTLNFSGLALASTTNSFMVLTPRSGFTANRLGEAASSQIATKSLDGS